MIFGIWLGGVLVATILLLAAGHCPRCWPCALPFTISILLWPLSLVVAVYEIIAETRRVR